MELNVIKESVAASEIICDSLTELPIECDMLLPDYCQDMMKVLKCTAQPVFSRNEMDGASFQVEGNVILTLYYVDEANKLRCYETKTPFSHMAYLKQGTTEAALSLAGHVEYLNCRAVNKRRAEIRGAMTLGEKAICKKKEEIVCDAQGGGMQLQRTMLPCSCLVAASQRQFTVREELALGSEKPAVGMFLHKEAQAVVSDAKVIANKVVLKGELRLSICYLSAEDETAQQVEYSLPVSQIIEATGVDEDCLADARLRVVSCRMDSKADLDGESTIISAEITLCATVQAHRDCQLTVLSDAYSTAYETSFEERPMEALCLSARVNDRHSYREEVELPPQVVSMTCFWCEAVFTGAEAEKNQSEATARLSGRLTFCMLAVDSDGMPVYFEKTANFEHKIELLGPEGDLMADLAMKSIFCEFTPLSNGRAEVRSEIDISGCMYTVLKCSVMSELSLDEQKPRQQDASTALTIYFAEPGERVWDIAKRYHTSVQAVMEENSIEQEALQNRATLLIPLIV